jgi:hypothetical protein
MIPTIPVQLLLLFYFDVSVIIFSCISPTLLNRSNTEGEGYSTAWNWRLDAPHTVTSIDYRRGQTWGTVAPPGTRQHGTQSRSSSNRPSLSTHWHQFDRRWGMAMALRQPSWLHHLVDQSLNSPLLFVRPILFSISSSFQNISILSRNKNSCCMQDWLYVIYFLCLSIN